MQSAVQLLPRYKAAAPHHEPGGVPLFGGADTPCHPLSLPSSDGGAAAPPCAAGAFADCRRAGFSGEYHHQRDAAGAGGRGAACRLSCAQDQHFAAQSGGKRRAGAVFCLSGAVYCLCKKSCGSGKDNGTAAVESGRCDSRAKRSERADPDGAAPGFPGGMAAGAGGLSAVGTHLFGIRRAV